MAIYNVYRGLGNWEYLYTTPEGVESHITLVGNIPGFLDNNPLTIVCAMEWLGNEPTARNMSFIIELPEGLDLSWTHIKHPILPAQC